MIIENDFLSDQKFIDEFYEIGYNGRFFETPLKDYSKDELIAVLGFIIDGLPKITLHGQERNDVGVLVSFNDEQYK